LLLLGDLSSARVKRDQQVSNFIFSMIDRLFDFTTLGKRNFVIFRKILKQVAVLLCLTSLFYPECEKKDELTLG
jgi:hypothetical protein